MNTKKSFDPIPFEHKGTKYLAVIPTISRQKRTIPIEEVISDERALDALLLHAWEGRDEESFDKNGIFKLVFSETSQVHVDPDDPLALLGKSSDSLTGSGTVAETGQDEDNGKSSENQ